MTVAVACNLSEGVILAVDSAVTLPTSDDTGIIKVYENAEKLFQLGDRPIGIAVYGLGAIGDRSIGSYVHEFEIQSPVVANPTTRLDVVVEEARDFLMRSYEREVIPVVEKVVGQPWDQIPAEKKPALGVVIGGFSPDAYLSEVWEIVLPRDATAGSAAHLRAQGNFGTNWFATFGPIRRYMKGFDPALIDEVIDYMVRRSTPLSPDELGEIRDLVAGHEYQIPYGAMPIEEGVTHTRFLAELVVNHYRFAVGAPVVGGTVHVGKVTYRHGAFEILN